LRTKRSADRSSVTAWLERGEQITFIRSSRRDVPTGHEEAFTMMLIGVDPHEATHTVVAVDEHEQPVARLQVPADRRQVPRLLGWAERLDDERVWAVESASGLGRLLAQQLVAAGEHVVDVPATSAARVRLLGSTRPAKNDPNDALSTAIAGLRHPDLRVVRVEDHAAVLRLLADRDHGLSALRTQAACRLHVMLRELIAGGAPLRLSADRAARLLRGVRLNTAVEVAAVAVSGTTLVELNGVGPIVAAIVLGQVGDPRRFPTRDRFAAYNGTAPLEASRGPRVRHRLNPRGNRQLNHALHLIAVTQIAHDTPARAYYDPKIAEGKSKKQARRALKRRISDTVWRQLRTDLDQHRTRRAREGQTGRLVSSVTGSAP
jgi:transposase